MVLNQSAGGDFVCRQSTDLYDWGSILIVGCDRNWLESTSIALEALQYRTLIAVNVDHALKIASDAKILAAIIECERPDDKGEDLARAIASNAARQGKYLNFILATVQPPQHSAVATFGQSMAYFIGKSCRPEELDELLQLFLTPVYLQPAASFLQEVQVLRQEMSSLRCSLQQAIDKDPRPVEPLPHKSRQIDADLVRRFARAEAARASVVGGKILGDPAWNILLDLLLASLEGRRVAVSSACIVAGVATTTALRLVNRMVSVGVLVRVPDSADGRRDYLHIEPDVETALKRYLFDLTQL